jgi:hypothetical protein
MIINLARVLERPLLLKRASDLLTPWLGETEQAIAEMFRQAKTEEAVLLRIRKAPSPWRKSSGSGCSASFG